MSKTLSNIPASTCKENVKDVKFFGNADTFRVLCKASSVKEGWMKSTKVCNLHNGCLVQVTTKQKNLDGSYGVAEALTFVPDNNMVTPEETQDSPRDKSIYNRFISNNISMSSSANTLEPSKMAYSNKESNIF